MDFHSHLSSNQVIGVLAGYVDPANHIVRVMHAMPVKEVPAENNRISVEMDAEDEHRARAMIEKLNMRYVLLLFSRGDVCHVVHHTCLVMHALLCSVCMHWYFSYMCTSNTTTAVST